MSVSAGGLFFIELFGGTEAIVAGIEDREKEGFTYRWETEWFNPITNRARFLLSPSHSTTHRIGCSRS